MTHLAQQQQSSAMMIHPCPAPRGFIHLFRFGHIHIVLGLIPITSISISRVSPILASSRALLAFFFRKKNRNHQHHHHHPYYSSYCTIKKKKSLTNMGRGLDRYSLSICYCGRLNSKLRLCSNWDISRTCGLSSRSINCKRFLSGVWWNLIYCTVSA